MVIDIIFVFVFLYGFYVGFSRGIIQTVFSILGYVVGLIAALKFGPSMSDFLKSSFNNDNPLMFIAGFIVTFVLTMLILRLFSRGLEGLFRSVDINIINQAAGGIFSAAFMILVYSVLLWFADKSSIIDNATKDDSMTYEYLEQYPAYVWEGGKKLKPVFQDFWDYTIEFMDQIEGGTSIERTESSPEIYDLDDNGNE